MKFDASRAESVFHELGQPRYAGSDGEAKVADFVASRFAEFGLDVERLAVAGSRFPQRVAPWVGWLGYGGWLTAGYVLTLQDGVFSAILAVLSICAGLRWLGAVRLNRIHPGRRLPPIETAPVVLAAAPGAVSAPARVVFQAVLGGLRADPFDFLGRNRAAAITKLAAFPQLATLAIAVACRFALLRDPGPGIVLATCGLLSRFVVPAVLTLTWLGIASLLAWEHLRARSPRGSQQAERRGLAVLLELARTWPRAGGRPIGPIFAAAGGQRLDHAGSREIVRRMGAEWADRPTLLVLFFAPGAGERLRLVTNPTAPDALHSLVPEAARSLWIPIDRDDRLALPPLWPFEGCGLAVAVIGSDPRAFRDESVDPRSFQQAAQLATEIALRWARTAATIPDPAA